MTQEQTLAYVRARLKAGVSLADIATELGTTVAALRALGLR